MSLPPSFFDRLKQRLQEPLPGAAAQYEMAHVGRQHAPEPPVHARDAGVLALFYPLGTEWHLVLIERQSHHPNDRHGGQISFPGGRVEPGDRHLQDTALRESEEEVGVPSRDVQVVGALSRLYIPVSNFLVHPFVGYTSRRPDFVPQESEVRGIIEVPFAHFLDSSNRVKTDIAISTSFTLRDVPCFAYRRHIVWGATAMMLSELLVVARPLIGAGKRAIPNR